MMRNYSDRCIKGTASDGEIAIGYSPYEIAGRSRNQTSSPKNDNVADGAPRGMRVWKVWIYIFRVEAFSKARMHTRQAELTKSMIT
jgi:hypothetical protein